MKHTPVKLDTFAMQVKPSQRGGPAEDLPEGTEYMVFDLRLLVNGIDLIAPQNDELIAIDDSQIWLAQRCNRRSWVLTCTCGDAGCAGFHEPVTTSRSRGRLTWTFPVSYFKWLLARGIVSGAARPVTFMFDAQQVYEQFQAAQAIVRQYEAQSGNPSAFSAGTYGKPYYNLDEQYARAEAWYLHRNKQRRYARHIGTRAGVCAGEPSASRTGYVV